MALNHPDTHYREGAAVLSIGSGFFRPESRPARDLSVLLARWQRGQASTPLRWLDLMAGCGIRAVRWGLESMGPTTVPVALHVNDADENRRPLIEANLGRAGLQAQVLAEPAETLLAQAYLDRCFFDLIDLDAFGAPSALLQPVLQVLRFEGLLLLASTDGRSPTGHDRPGAIRSLGAAARVHPASWEMALRQQLGLLARQAWMLGRGLQPVLSFSEGRTFRLAVRLRRQLQRGEEQQLGLIARCDGCGAQAVQPLLNLTGWPACHCSTGQGRWTVSGPLWIGPLQDVSILGSLQADCTCLPAASVAPASKRLLQRLLADPGLPAKVWPTAELSRRVGCGGPPPLPLLVETLRRHGHHAYASGVMAGQVRTDAELPDLLQTCNALRQEGI